MTQDSLLYDEVKGRSVRDSQLVDQLKCCNPKEAVHGVLDNWASALRIVFENANPWPDPHLWFSFYNTLLHAAADGDLLLSLSRVAKPVEGYLYFSADRIRNERPQDVDLYYGDVDLPCITGSKGKFIKHGFEYAIANLLPIWQAFWDDLPHARSIGRNIDKSLLIRTLHNWNLDTGADMDKEDSRVDFWQGSMGS